MRAQNVTDVSAEGVGGVEIFEKSCHILVMFLNKNIPYVA